TNLTHGRPYRLPFQQDVFFFDPAEFRTLFPAHVVDWMVAHPRSSDDARRPGPLCPLPRAADMPVIVAARMSLSFPILISAVPLYAVDYSRAGEQDRKPTRCWFSDGGISSNFPVHFFDSILPRWPTFAINLRRFQADRQTEEQAVWMPADNREGIGENWNLFETDPEKQLTGFVAAILQSMQNWNDNTQLVIPGYRDRIVHVALKDDE